MNNDDLVLAFSKVCSYVADNFEDILRCYCDDEIAMLTPFFWEAHISDINQWWEWNDHLPKYLVQIAELESQTPNSRQENIDAGIEEIQSNPRHWAELKSLVNGTDDGVIKVLKHIPHVAQYASCLTNTEGYKKLDALTERMDNIFIWPQIVINQNCDDLKSAFFINVTIVSGDGRPLKPKAMKFRNFNA